MNEFEELLSKKKLPSPGICESIKTKPCKDILKLIKPGKGDYAQLSNEGKSFLYWGSDSWRWLFYEMTPLRQTILMLCNEIYKDTYDKKRKKRNLSKSS